MLSSPPHVRLRPLAATASIPARAAPIAIGASAIIAASPGARSRPSLSLHPHHHPLSMGQRISKFLRLRSRTKDFTLRTRTLTRHTRRQSRNYVCLPGSFAPDASEVMDYTDQDFDAVVVDVDPMEVDALDEEDADARARLGPLGALDVQGGGTQCFATGREGHEHERRVDGIQDGNGYDKGVEDRVSPLMLRRPAMYDAWFGSMAMGSE